MRLTSNAMCDKMRASKQALSQSVSPLVSLWHVSGWTAHCQISHFIKYSQIAFPPWSIRVFGSSTFLESGPTLDDSYVQDHRGYSLIMSNETFSMLVFLGCVSVKSPSGIPRFHSLAKRGRSVPWVHVCITYLEQPWTSSWDTDVSTWEPSIRPIASMYPLLCTRNSDQVQACLEFQFMSGRMQQLSASLLRTEYGWLWIVGIGFSSIMVFPSDLPRICAHFAPRSPDWIQNPVLIWHPTLFRRLETSRRMVEGLVIMESFALRR